MNVLIINDTYWPHPNALSFCIDHILEYFTERDTAYLLCLKKDASEEDEEVVGKANVKRVYVPHYARCCRLHQKASGNIANKLIFHLISRRKTDKAENYRNSLFCKKTLSAALDLIDRMNIKSVLTVSSPFSAHILGEAIKKKRPSVKWIAYQLDPFANNRYLRSDGVRTRADVERRALSAADRVFQLSCVYGECLRDGVLTGNEKNIVSLTLPGLRFDPKQIKESEPRAEGVVGVYAGNIYDQRIKTVASQIAEAMDVPTTVHFYGKGTGSFSGKRLVGHGFVSNEERDRAISECDFLLIEGDAAPNQVPSKIISYVKSGKPILLFSFSENDSLTEYLEPYGNSLSLMLEVPLADAELKKACGFIKNARASRLTQEEIEKRMARFSDDNVSKVIYDALVGNDSNQN